MGVGYVITISFPPITPHPTASPLSPGKEEICGNKLDSNRLQLQLRRVSMINSHSWLAHSNAKTWCLIANYNFIRSRGKHIFNDSGTKGQYQ